MHGKKSTIANVILEHVVVHRDQRGCVFEPLGPDLLAAQQNVHVVLTEPGCVRGTHYHNRGTEILTVCGPALVRLRGEGDVLEETLVPEGNAIRFTIPSGVSHAIKNTGARPSVIVAFNSLRHNPEDPDVRTDILIET